MKSKYGRTGIRRSGDDYQDIIALETMVDFLEHREKYRWIRVEADDKGFLDDVVALRNDGSFEVKQVKFSGYPKRQSDVWTWAKLIEKEDGKKSLIEKWANSVEIIKKQGRIFKASVESNRRSEEIKRTLDASNHVIFDKIRDKKIRDKLVEQIGGEDRARDFFSVFCFNLDRPGLNELEEAVKKRFFHMGITKEGWKNLKDELRSWIRAKEEPKPGGEITLEKIKIAALWHKLELLYQKFPIPEDFVIPSEDFHRSILKELVNLKNGCIVVAANPGMGKSTYLSFLYNHLDSNKVPIIRHHYFISMQDRTFGRCDHMLVAESLMSEIKVKYPDYLGELRNKNVTCNDLSQWLDVCGKEFRNRGKSLIIIIDGMDYVWREKQSIDELVDLFEHIFPTPEGIIVIIGTQPIDDEKIPLSLLQEVPREKWKYLPPLDLQAVRKWIRNYEDRIDLPQDRERRNNILDRLAEMFYQKSNGHPLYLHYSIKTIQQQELEINFDTIESLPECPHHDIVNYYDILLSRLSEEGKQILHLLSVCPFPWTPEGIIECLKPQVPDSSRIISSLHKTKHLMRGDPCGFVLFHNSLNVFLRERSDHTTYSNILKPLALDWLAEKAPEYVRWNFLWLIKAETGDEEPLIRGPNREWVINAISKPFPRKGVSQILAQSAKIALKKEDLVRAIEIGFLRDYYNFACDFRSEIFDNLFYSQLIINDDPFFHASIRSEVSTNTHTQLVYFSERNKENQAIVEECYTELLERQRGNRPERTGMGDEWISLINSFLRVAALYEKTDFRSIVEGSIKVKSEGTYSDALEVFCQALRTYRKSHVFRDLLKLKIPHEDFYIVLKYAILLSFEESFDLSNEVLDNSSHAFAAIYASIQDLSQYSISSIKFPPTNLFELTESEQYLKKNKITHMFYEVFFVFLANHLWQESKRNGDWIKQISFHSWPKELIRILNEAAKELAQLIKTKSCIPFDWLHKKVNSLKRPMWPEDRYYKNYGDCAETAINRIALDLLPIAAALGRNPEIRKVELKNIFSTQYCDCWTWLDLFVPLRRSWVNRETLEWVGPELDSKVRSSIDLFSERALNYSRLAALYSLHGKNEESKMYVVEAAKNLLTYGDHKDVLLFSVLDTLKFCYDANIAETRKWLIKVIPAILWVREFTDGDETRHLPNELGHFLGKYEPELLPSYHAWLLKQEEFHYATSLIHSFLRNADLNDPINQAIAKTAIDEESLLALCERAKTNNQAAEIVLSSIAQLLGENAIKRAKNKKSEEELKKSTSLHLPKENLPNPERFPPEKFKDYITTVNSLGYFPNCVEKWIAHWINTPQKQMAYQSIKKAIEKGTRLYEYDSFFDLALSVVGKDQAYPWLVKALIERYGWNPYWTSREISVNRWQTIKRHYPDRWFDFIRDTLEPMFKEPWKYMSTNMFVRLVEYCFYMEKPELAKNVSRQAVASTLELISPLTLPIPEWLAKND